MNNSNRQIQKEQTRELLIRTAYQVFSEHGILNTRMSDIAETAGVSHGTVFLHFKTQEALITQVVSTYCGQIAERTHELSASTLSIKDLLSAHLSGIEEFEPFYIRLVTESSLLPTPSKDAWVNLQSAIAFHFSKALEQSGCRSDVPAFLLFNMWVGLIHHYLSNRDLFAPDNKIVEKYRNLWIENFIRIISKPG